MLHQSSSDKFAKSVYIDDLTQFNKNKKSEKGNMIGVFPSLLLEKRVKELAKNNEICKADVVRTLCARALDVLEEEAYANVK